MIKNPIIHFIDFQKTLQDLKDSSNNGNSYLETIDYLIKNGLYINLQDEKGWSVLTYAIANNSTPELIKAIIDSGINLDLKDEHGWTHVMHAAALQDFETLKYLLKFNPDLTIKDNEGSTVLDKMRSFDLKTYKFLRIHQERQKLKIYNHSVNKIKVL